MSEITGKQFSEPFKMRIVSGMLVNGSIRISWATGEPASSQLDWGYDDSVPNRTPEYHTKPNEMLRYHQLFFPKTLVDTRHYFRVRSRAKNGKTGVSEVYMVFVPKEMQMQVGGKLAGEIELELIPVTAHQLDSANMPDTLLSGYRTEPISSGHTTAEASHSAPAPIDQQKEDGISNLSTTFTITIT